MPVVLLFIIFVVLLMIAIPVSITLGITAVLPSIFDPSFTVGAKYLIRAMFGGLDSFPLLAVPMFVLSGIIMAKGGISRKLFDVFAYFLGNFTAGMPCAVVSPQSFNHVSLSLRHNSHAVADNCNHNQKDN